MKIRDGKGPESIKVEVLYYDPAEALKLGAAPVGNLGLVAGQVIDIPTSEFLTYYLFNLKRSLASQPTYRTLGSLVSRASSELEGFVDFSSQSICTADGIREQRTEITERIGEAVGLCVISRIHQLTYADWIPIDKESGRGAYPTLDYELASDGSLHVQVENKGSSVADNREKSSTIYQHAANIRDKKRNSRMVTEGVRYGTITAIDPRKDGIVRCYLLDPPLSTMDREPPDARLLIRMRFLSEWISFLSPKSQLASALNTRVSALQNLAELQNLDGVPLLRGDQRPFEMSPILGELSRFFNTKSTIVDGTAGGVVMQVSPNHLFFVGIMEDLPILAANQEFERIRSYALKAGSERKRVRCLFPRGRLRELALPKNIEVLQRAGYTGFTLEGRIHYSQAGLVFGFLPLNPE